MNKIIAVNIGGVIRTKNEHASIETDNYLEAPVVPGAKEGLTFLVECFGAENVHLVSRCRLSKQVRSMEWLEHNGIFALGVLRENVHLCVGFEGKLAKLIEIQKLTWRESKIKLEGVALFDRLGFILIDDRKEVFEAIKPREGVLFVTEDGEKYWKGIIWMLSSEPKYINFNVKL